MVESRVSAAALDRRRIGSCPHGHVRHPQIAVRNHIAREDATKVPLWIIGVQGCLGLVRPHPAFTADRAGVS